MSPSSDPTVEQFRDLGEKFQALAHAEWERRSNRLRQSRDLLSIAVVLAVVSLHQILLLLQYWFLQWGGKAGAHWFSFFLALALIVIAGGVYHAGLRRLQQAFALPESPLKGRS